MSKFLLAAIWLFLATTGFSQDDDGFKRPAPSDYPKIRSAAAGILDFVPPGFRVVEQAAGDLNSDGRPDAALVLRGESKIFLNKNEGLGEDPYNTNPRILVILFRDNTGYRLVGQSNTFIIPPPSPVNSEPFQAIAIKDRVLRIDLELWQSAGGWGMTSAAYKFRYDGSEFVLIGADRTDAMRNTGETETYSYNFVTRKVSITKGNFESTKKGVVRWRKLGNAKARTLKTFPVPFEWEIQKDLFL